MPQNTTINCPMGQWTQLTNADAATVTFQNIGKSDVRIAGTASATPPSTTNGSIAYLPNQGERAVALADLFPGISSPVRVYAYSGGGTQVMISHA